MNKIDLELLKLLKENKNDFISGEEMSSYLEVSRTTIWKHIKKLREQGFMIESITNKGYSLQGEPDSIIPEEIILDLNTGEIGREILTFDKLDSTNNSAKELAREGNYQSGTVVLAEEQLKGKGRLGRSWYSPPGTGLFFSIILKPKNLAPLKAPFLTIVACLAVVEAIRDTYKNIGDISQEKENQLNEVCLEGLEIKWPNDILLNKKKISGILSEMSADMDIINYAVVGIGVNVNQENFPEEIKTIASSLKIEKQKKVDRKELFKLILEYFEQYYSLLVNEQEKILLEKWKEYLNILNENVLIINNEEKIRGRVINISERGELILEAENGKTHSFWAGDVSLRKEN
ncbi:biotin--[acetyl-CoA-carboxylase] ligase [Natronospora cellulosivora (SeqCode)]